jgi:hypothetical protein
MYYKIEIMGKINGKNLIEFCGSDNQVIDLHVPAFPGKEVPLFDTLSKRCTFAGCLLN